MDNSSNNQNTVSIDPNLMAPQDTPPLTPTNPLATTPGVIDITPGSSSSLNSTPLSSTPPAVVDITPSASTPPVADLAPQGMSGASLADIVTSTSAPSSTPPAEPLVSITPPMASVTPPVTDPVTLTPTPTATAVTPSETPVTTAAPLSTTTPASPLQEDPNLVNTIG